MSRPTLFTGDDNTLGREFRSSLPPFAVHSPVKEADFSTEMHSTTPAYAAKAHSFTTRTEARQDEIDHRENQLNARMAQFETLVRNTKVSLQTKMEELALREEDLRKGEEQLQHYRQTFEDQLERQRYDVEQDRADLHTRKQAVEERLVRRERELSELAAEREREIAVQAEDYRQQLEAQLLAAKADYQNRFELRCREIENEFIHRLADEKKLLEGQQRTIEEVFNDRARQLDKEVEQRKIDACLMTEHGSWTRKSNREKLMPNSNTRAGSRNWTSNSRPERRKMTRRRIGGSNR